MTDDQSDVVVIEGDKTTGSETGALSPVTTISPERPIDKWLSALGAIELPGDDDDLLSAAYHMTVDMDDQSQVGEKRDQTRTGEDTPPVSPAPTLPATSNSSVTTTTDVVGTVLSQNNEPEASHLTPLKRKYSRKVDKEVKPKSKGEVDGPQKKKKSRKSTTVDPPKTGPDSREKTVSPIPTYFGLTDMNWPVDANGFARNPPLPHRVFTLEADRDVEVHVFRRPDIPGVST